jgi:hypothetical protein
VRQFTCVLQERVKAKEELEEEREGLRVELAEARSELAVLRAVAGMVRLDEETRCLSMFVDDLRRQNEAFVERLSVLEEENRELKKTRRDDDALE